MAPKKKNPKKKEASTPDDVDLSEIPEINVCNIVIGEVQTVKKVPNGTLLHCYVEVPDRDDEVFIVTNAKVEEGQKVITALAPVPLPNGLEVEVRNIGGYDSEGMFCGPQELLWPTAVFRADQPITLPQAEVGPVPSYEQCLQLRNVKKAGGAGGKKKKGGAGGAGGDDEDEDFDAMLKEFGVVDEKANKKKKEAVKPPQAAAAAATVTSPTAADAKKDPLPATTSADAEGGDDDDNLAGLTGNVPRFLAILILLPPFPVVVD